MPVDIKRGFMQMLSEAVDQVDEVSVAAVAQALDIPASSLSTYATKSELSKADRARCTSASRGMLEVHADRPRKAPSDFAEAESLILYCGTSGRSALRRPTHSQQMALKTWAYGWRIQSLGRGGHPVDSFTPKQRVKSMLPKARVLFRPGPFF